MENQQTYQPIKIKQPAAPYSIPILVLGISSLVFFLVYGAGIVLGIIALIYTKKANLSIKNNPNTYNPSSFKMIKSGKICALIGTILSALALIIMIISVVFLVSTSAHHHINSYSY